MDHAETSDALCVQPICRRVLRSEGCGFARSHFLSRGPLGLSIQPANINIQMVPGFEHVITVTPNQSGAYSLVCNEYCGIGHHRMVSRLYVK